MKVRETMAMDILEAPFMQELIRTCGSMYRLGWNERNGGNISMIIDEGEFAFLGNLPILRNFSISFDAKDVAGRFLAVTRGGSYFRNVEIDPAHNLGILRISDDGKSAGLLWGFTGEGQPTSELSAHIRSHTARLRQDPHHQVVTHCHATNTVAMTYIHELSDKAFSHTLWQMESECIVVFPEGVGVLPWMIQGSDEIGKATAAKMESYRVCIWAQHGVFAAGGSLDEAFGLLETVEKAATIYIKIGRGGIMNTIRDHELKSLAEAFKVNYRKDFLSL
ncbi:MAG: rhamnulose-1-phosphate aldolase [Treponema sp.]|jgi:rhamnulose-1-phosphate aldolase|nr:rhamnulose-1-phosphate aldolase [Treponema sp.]